MTENQMAAIARMRARDPEEEIRRLRSMLWEAVRFIPKTKIGFKAQRIKELRSRIDKELQGDV